MHKKDLGLFVLILIVGAITASLNPRFLSPVNLVNMANLIGLFGLFSIGEELDCGAESADAKQGADAAETHAEDALKST